MDLKKIVYISGSALAGIIIIGFFIRHYYKSQAVSEILDPIRAGEFTSAEKQVAEKILHLVGETEANPDSAGYWGKLGMNLYIHDYKESSVPCFEKAAELDDQDFRWPYFCGVALDELNDGRAIEWYERSRLLKPAYPPLGVKLGNLYLLSGRPEKAEQVFNAVFETGAEIPHVYLGLAKISIEKGQLEIARNLLEGALNLAPEYREAHAMLAEIFRRQGERSKAEDRFQRMKHLPNRLDLSDPVYSEMINEGVSSFWCQVRGNNFIRAGNLAAAEIEFTKALQAKPNQTSYSSLGSVYQMQKNYAAAIEQYQAALDLDSNYVDALNNMGIIYFNHGNVDKAISLVERALKIQPESIDCYLNLGTFYKKKRDDRKALGYFRGGLNRAAADSRFTYQLSWLLAASPVSEIRDGRAAVQNALKLCDQTGYKNAAIVDLLAAAYAEDGQFKKAQETAQKAHVLARSAGNDTLAREIGDRINLYRNKQAYRER